MIDAGEPPPAVVVDPLAPTHPSRVVVTGSESTGKTTLARDLATFLGARWISEYSRAYAETTNRPLTAEDVEPIARGQIALEDRELDWHGSCHASHSSGTDVTVLDTDLVSTTVYSEFYYGACPPWILRAARARMADLYLLCAVDLPWVGDGVRDQPDARHAMQRHFADRLREFDALVLPIDGRGETRLAHAVAAIRGWRAARACVELVVR